MKNILSILFLLIISGLSSSILHGQSIARSTMCSIGVTQTSSDGTTITTTFGQCPGCTTLAGQNGQILTQGFQQPNGINPDCIDLAAFDSQPTESPCGTTYSFIYLGNADANAQFVWDFGADALPQTSSLENPIDIAFSSIGSKEITLRVITSTCDVSESISVMVTELAFGVGTDISPVACLGGDSGGIILEPTNGVAPFTVAWSNGAIGLQNNNLLAGDYSYTIIDADGCEASNTVNIMEPAEDISIDFTISRSTCGNAENGVAQSMVTGGTAPYTFLWSNGVTVNTITNVRQGSYNLTVTDANGCTAIANAEVGEACRPTIYNLFSPNGDGQNDNWEIVGIQDFPDNEVEIYNRWGNIVYEMSGYDNSWTGTNNSGEELLSGAYYYVVKLNNDEDTILTGSVTIIR